MTHPLQNKIFSYMHDDPLTNIQIVNHFLLFKKKKKKKKKKRKKLFYIYIYKKSNIKEY